MIQALLIICFQFCSVKRLRYPGDFVHTAFAADASDSYPGNVSLSQEADPFIAGVACGS